MFILAIFQFCLGFFLGSFVGILILGYPMRRKQPSPLELGRSAAISLLLAALMAVISSAGFFASESLATASLIASAHKAMGAIGAMGAAVALVLTGAAGCVEALAARVSQKR